MVVIALGTNLGDRAENLREAAAFLQTLSDEPLRKSAIWKTEPVGPSDKEFLNAVILMPAVGSPAQTLSALKKYEREAGRDPDAPRWSDRIIDLDIIAWNRDIYLNADLEIPHISYRSRLFVLKPMQELLPAWIDPETGDHIDDLIKKASPLDLSKTSLKW